MNEAFKQTLMQGGADLILALLGLVFAYLIAYLRKGTAHLAAETNGLKNQEQSSVLKDAIARLDDLAERSVAKFEQTVAADLRKAVQDGKVDREELLAVGKEAVDEVTLLAGPELMDILSQGLGDAQTFVENTIEQKVLKLKTNTLISSANKAAQISLTEPNQNTAAQAKDKTEVSTLESQAKVDEPVSEAVGVTSNEQRSI
ncbi:MAG: hypothetical protein QMC95_06465 [Desulfitobacteriaceae bacterium]|nr:hypothetical protein [Desulfitobacteriaceae bacterium]